MIGPVITPFGKMAQNEERWRDYLKRIATGDRPSLARFYDDTSSLVYGLALRILNDPSDASELVLEVYHRIWNAPAKLEAGTSVLASLTTITRALALDRLRKEDKRQGRVSVPAVMPSPEFVLGHERDLVVRALALLDPAQREAIELAFFCGMTEAELAGAMAVSTSVIRTRIISGMRQLNEALRTVSSMEGNA